ncbi:hypothetical protein OKW40_003024 [Paraburkholderia sp. RAU6.4a]|nr:hypothetical protein [Paraburkholderia sp. HC6.4b]
MIQSIAEAHMSKGVAAAWPTTGSTFRVAAVTRHGSAAAPQPPSGNSSAPATSHATARRRCSVVLDNGTRTSPIHAVVLSRWPMSPVPGAGSAGFPSPALCCDFAAAPVEFELADFSVAGLFASEEKGVELSVLWIVMMDLAKVRIAHRCRLNAARRRPRQRASFGVRRDLLRNQSSRRAGADDGRSKARFRAVVTIRSVGLRGLSSACQLLSSRACRRAEPDQAVLK